MNTEHTDMRMKQKGETAKRRLPYTSPKVVVYGDVSDLTKSGGTYPPHDSEVTSTRVSP